MHGRKNNFLKLSENLFLKIQNFRRNLIKFSLESLKTYR